MSKQSILQQALGTQWQEMPVALQAHYNAEDNADIGTLDIDYPRAMQWPLNILHLLGALLNKRGQALPATVEKRMVGDRQYWKRTIRLPSDKVMVFSSTWRYMGGNRLVEYVNPVLGLCMAVHVGDGKLYYEGQYFVVNLFGLHIPVPEWLLLGHTQIVETALDEQHFAMDFRLLHPLFGKIYRYAGRFTTVRS